MISATLAVIFAAILMFAIVAAALYGWHLWKLWLERRKYTRERFLFEAFRLLGRLLLAYMAFVFGGAWPFTFLASWAADSSLSLRITPDPPSEIAILGTTAVLVCITVLIWRIFTSWPGERSEHERRYGRLNLRETVSLAAVDRGRRRLMRHPAREDTGISTHHSGWSVPGHLRALNLILAYDGQYQISENHWHDEERAFIGCYGKEEEPYIFFYAETLTPEFSQHIDKVKLRYAKHRKRVLLEISPGDTAFPDDDDTRVITFGDIMFESHRLNAYKRALVEELTVKRFGENAPAIQDMLVTLKAEMPSDREPIPDINEHILNWVSHGPYNQHIAILGEYGQGKSVLSIWICALLIEHLEQFRRIPILIQLGGKSPRNSTVEEIIDAWAGRYRINANLARAWVETGHAVVIFDAFDEMDLVGDRSLRLQNFMRIWEFAERPAASLVVTGRPNLFFDTDEMRVALKLTSDGVAGHHARSVYLSKLSREQIEDALREWLQVGQAVLRI